MNTKRSFIIAGILGVFGLLLLNALNVSATDVTITENLSVTPNVISFETVFPEEVQFRPMNIALSGSFIDSPIHDDVEYRILQRPKPRIDSQAERDYCATNPTDYTRCYPSLCPYLSKEADGTPGNDTSISAFHDPNASTSIVYGRLAKSDNDLADQWNIDLHVPCFRGQCAQDWASYVHAANPNADPSLYLLDPALEHETFGCDLIVEITSVSYFQTVTRTPGFWQPHTAFTSQIFAANFPSGMIVGTSTHQRLVTNVPGNGQSRLFGAFYSSIPKKTNNANRTALDKARMQLLQQLVSAKLNCAAFSCMPSVQTMVVAADVAYAGTNTSAILTSLSLLDAYNNSGEPLPIPPSFTVPSATPATSQLRANKVFWDSP